MRTLVLLKPRVTTLSVAHVTGPSSSIPIVIVWTETVF